MTPRNPLDDTAPFDLLGDLASAPLSDGASGLGGRFARQGHDLANLFVGDRWRLARARRVGQTLFYREFRERYRAPLEPAGSPVAGGIYADCFLMGNLSVVKSVGRRQDQARTQRELLGRSMAFYEPLEFLALDFG